MESLVVLFASVCVAIIMLLKNRVEKYTPSESRITPLTAGWSN